MNLVNLKPGFYAVSTYRNSKPEVHMYVHTGLRADGSIPTVYEFTSEYESDQYCDCGGYLWNGFNSGNLHATNARPLLPFEIIALKFKLTMFLRQEKGRENHRRFE